MLLGALAAVADPMGALGDNPLLLVVAPTFALRMIAIMRRWNAPRPPSPRG